MAQGIYADYPPELSEAESQYLLTNVKDWSIAHGLAVRPPPAFVTQEQDPGLALATTAPVTLFPSLFPRGCFEQGVSIQELYNKLYSAIARDEKWLRPIIEEYVDPEANRLAIDDVDDYLRLLDIDSFVAELWRVHVAVAQEGYAQVHQPTCLSQPYADSCRTSHSVSSAQIIWFMLTQTARARKLGSSRSSSTQ
jgi:hypothetical protein